MARILVTGGAGYIGSHTCVLLAKCSHEVIVVDNLINSSEEAVRRVSSLSGCEIPLHKVDIRDTETLQLLLRGVDAVVHFAALKAVGESSECPLSYYDNNVGGIISLLSAMSMAGCTRIVFSSSATVYGGAISPVGEDAATGAVNPYGRTKLMAEEIIRDACASSKMSAVLLRYFNPVGAHPTGLLGESPQGAPNNLMPFIAQVASGRRAKLRVFGADYPTIDGTGVRDYIHVMDLAEAHVTAVKFLLENRCCIPLNLGTGRGYSVLEVIRAFELVSGSEIPYEIAPRRPGDVAALWANPTLALQTLGWRAKHGLEKMCEDSWRWQSMNPNGFSD